MAKKIGKWYITLNNPRELLAHSRMMYDYGYLQEQRVERLQQFLEAKEKSLEKDAQLYEMMLKNIKRTSRYYYKVILGSTKNSARLELVKEMLKILNN